MVDPGQRLRTAVEMMLANFEELAVQKQEHDVEAPQPDFRPRTTPLRGGSAQELRAKYLESWLI